MIQKRYILGTEPGQRTYSIIIYLHAKVKVCWLCSALVEFSCYETIYHAYSRVEREINEVLFSKFHQCGKGNTGQFFFPDHHPKLTCGITFLIDHRTCYLSRHILYLGLPDESPRVTVSQFLHDVVYRCPHLLRIGVPPADHTHREGVGGEEDHDIVSIDGWEGLKFRLYGLCKCLQKVLRLYKEW
jgi:hypothetical protein